MIELLIKEKINSSYAVSYESAEKVLPIIKESLKKGVVILNFSGISVLSSPFLSGTIGLLVKDYSLEYIKEKILLENLPLGGEKNVEAVLKNSELFYRSK